MRVKVNRQGDAGGEGRGCEIAGDKVGVPLAALRETGGEVEVLQRSNGRHLEVTVWCHVVAARRNWWAASGEGKAFLGMVWAMFGWMKMKR